LRDVESEQSDVVLLVDGLSDRVYVSVASLKRLLAGPLPEMLADLRRRLESTIDQAQAGAEGSGPVKVEAWERDALQDVIFKAKYQRRKGMPMDLVDLEERLRPSNRDR
jgi:hypothetical protein